VIAPHRVNAFTLSLDAIKSYEYLASGRRIVATPTSGFQSLTQRLGIHVVTPREFIDTISRTLTEPAPLPVLEQHDWRRRAQAFAQELELARRGTLHTRDL
jgi:glycosyltransferase involved in cell wall biosynthesis